LLLDHHALLAHQAQLLLDRPQLDQQGEVAQLDPGRDTGEQRLAQTSGK
jgi:hypothetical protein